MTLPSARADDWGAVSAVVAGIGVAGYAVADALLRVGASVFVVDDRETEDAVSKASTLRSRGADVRLGPGASAQLPDVADVVVTSPGWPPDAPLLAAASAAGVPIWSEIELAWRLRDPDVPWLMVTGTNGKTTTVRMLAAMLRADGRNATAAGNVGEPLVTSVLADTPYDVIAVEASSFQLHFTDSVAAEAAVVLNVAPDHLDWHGGFDAYVADKARVYRGASVRVFNADDPLPRQSDGGSLELGVGTPTPNSPLTPPPGLPSQLTYVGFTLGEPEAGMLGVVGGVLVDRAYGERAALADVSDIPVAGPHNVANALAAAALARSVGVRPEAVRDALRGFQPEPHRVETVATFGGVTFVDDSKATNPHAAAASLSAFDTVVWVAGGLAKGATFDDLVSDVRHRLRGAVLLGADRVAIRDALTRHAPNVPVIDVAAIDNEAMDQVVVAAMKLAEPGDTVVLAPACASQDIFANYAVRGDAFAAAVRRHGGG